MASQGPNPPGTAGTSNSNGGTINWGTASNILSDNGTYAQASTVSAGTSYYLLATNYGFSVTGSVNGIIVEVDRRDTAGVTQDAEVKLIIGGTVVGDNKADTATNWPAASAYATYGGAAVLWGLTPTAAEINASTFGVALSATLAAGFHSAEVDFIRVTVHYTDAAFDPASGGGAFFRSQTRVFEAVRPGRSSFTTAALEQTLVMEPTRAFFIAGRGIVPPPEKVRGAKTYAPASAPPDQLPPVGWDMAPTGQAPRGPWVPNRSRWVGTLEPTNPPVDAWVTVRKPTRLPPPGPSRGTVAFVGPQTGPTFSLMVKAGGRAIPPRGSVRLVDAMVDQFGAAVVMNKGRRGAPTPSRSGVVYVQPPDVSSPVAVVFGRRVTNPPRGWVRVCVPNIVEYPMPAYVVMTQGKARTAIPSRIATRILETISTGIIPIGWLKQFGSRMVPPVLQAGKPVDYITEPMLTISTATRQDNRNSGGARRGATSTGGSGRSRSSSGVGTGG